MVSWQTISTATGSPLAAFRRHFLVLSECHAVFLAALHALAGNAPNLAFVSISLHRALSASPVLAAVRIRNWSAHAAEVSCSQRRGSNAGKSPYGTAAWERPSWPCWVSREGDRGARASAPGSRRCGSLTRSGLDPVDPQRVRAPGGNPALHTSLCRGKPIDLPRHDSPYIRPYARRRWTHQRASYGQAARPLMTNWRDGIEVFWISEETKRPETAD